MKQHKHTRKHRRRKSCKIHTHFDLNSATAFGGAAGLIDFVLQTGMDKYFCTEELGKRKDAQFQMDDVALTFVLGTLLGQERIFHFEDIEHDPLLMLKLDLPKLPDTTLLYKDLKRLGSPVGMEAIRSAQRLVLKSLLPKGHDIVVDIDSSVETVFGNQEQSAVGFNPHHHGRASFHPLLAFESQMGCCIYDELRSGDAHTAEGFAAFYEAMKKQLPTGVNIRAIRMDKGFTGEKVFQTLEQDGRDYVIKLKWTKRLAELAPNLAWHCITQSDTEHCDVASLMYQATSWEKPRRVVIVRRLDIDPQEVLCADWFWEYEAIATTFDWNGEDIWHFYNHRGNAENHIKEAKYGFAVDQFSSQNFNTNKALEALKLLAYNLLLLYKQAALQPGVRQWTVGRLRRRLFLLPGILVHHARQWTIRLPEFAQRLSTQVLQVAT
ncbi:IS1380 family transposase [Alicyclobacillus dauci]|uniref:IS1380 family transposase n=1 Tax=Alicyclobacillus dauci TaxID=1475485 RepID=A0ABY6Z784_9BACL|nr:IS1380 family transposase [Alicyclobacillus dauci]WAH35704.1 IS1380 family transposase [Alicyclobacillus dauci]WAH36460.1 IS1380 family transposase [Alicyclobacillus dauci]WAH38054.1 IS1380 family transposase [Alicyclobacillus dauci]WAH38745.1 IS1380 family transposase [Alicyclobacillus dauci]WAH38776.1 IS1380 family transposase [Alicyclobacillus dauci]